MSQWVSLFYVGPHQSVPVAAGIVVWIALAGLGYFLTGRDRIIEALPFVGWAVVSTVFTVVGAFIPGAFFALAIGCGAMAIAGWILALRRGEAPFVAGSWRVLVVALPMLWIAGAMDPSQWDEFSHWLPAPLYLLKHHGFPTAALPYDGAPMLPAYPYGWPLLHYLSALLAGRFINNIGGILNLLMLLSFAAFVLRSAFAIVGRPRSGTMGWPFAAAAALVATALNPTFVQKIVLTAYSDVSSSVLTGVVLLVGYQMIERLSGRNVSSLIDVIWQFALVLALLINLRQPNLVVVIAAILGLAVVAWRDRDVSFIAFGASVSAALVLPLLVYIVWRGYVGREFATLGFAEASLMPFSDWNIGLIGQIVAAMAGVAFKKIAFFGPMVVAVVFAARALWNCKSGFDRIAIMTATVFVAYNAFLLFTYVAHFGRGQAVSVVSYWRYNIDVGMIVLIFGSVALLTWWRGREAFDRYPRWLAPAALCAVIVLPAAFVEKLRFDLEPPKPHFIRVAKDMAGMSLKTAHYVLDPTGTGESAVITRVTMDVDGKPWLSAFHNTAPEQVDRFIAQVQTGEYLLIHSLCPGVDDAMGVTLSPRSSYLFRRDPGEWILIKSWEKPADHPW